VHPRDLHACRLQLQRYALGTDSEVTPTPPYPIMALTGIPQVDADGDGHSLVRVWSAFPATATIEWGDSPSLANATVLPPAGLDVSPYTHAERIPLAAAGGRYWRATLRSATSGATVHTAVQHVQPYSGSGELVLLAVSCAQLTGPPPNAGYARLLEAAPAVPSALVYQGDIGYPNNTAEACYAAAPDYFADRFGRLLADPNWPACAPPSRSGSRWTTTTTAPRTTPTARPSSPGRGSSGTGSTPTPRRSGTSTSAWATCIA